MIPNERNLIRRYLIWCYKTTKENLDRIDRKTTQLMVDNRILEDLKQSQKKFHSKNAQYGKSVKGFEQYIRDKQKSEHPSAPEHLYLANRFKAVEHSIIYFLGQKELKIIQSLYEQEMIRRILEAREER